MKYLIFFLFSLSAFANPPTGEFKHCVSGSETDQAYLHVVHFGAEEFGVQMFYQNFPISFRLILDKQVHESQEAISGMMFRYRAAYANNVLKVVFENPAKAEAMGLNQKFIIQFEGLVAKFYFDGVYHRCRMRI